MNGSFFSLSPSLLFHFLSSPYIFFFTFFFWCERFDIYIGFGQGSEKGNGFICGLSIRSGYFLKTHEKKYMYIYKYELWRGFQFNKFESFFFFEVPMMRDIWWILCRVFWSNYPWPWRFGLFGSGQYDEYFIHWSVSRPLGMDDSCWSKNIHFRQTKII